MINTSKKEIIKKLMICEDLIKSRMTVREQIGEWIGMNCGSARTFFNYKKVLLQQKPELQKYAPLRTFVFKNKINQDCYFCTKKGEVIHHINENREDNSSENLMALCRSCHNKIHRFYNGYFLKVKANCTMQK